jgi:hypothetical protein
MNVRYRWLRAPATIVRPDSGMDWRRNRPGCRTPRPTLGQERKAAHTLPPPHSESPTSACARVEVRLRLPTYRRVRIGSSRSAPEGGKTSLSHAGKGQSLKRSTTLRRLGVVPPPSSAGVWGLRPTMMKTFTPPRLVAERGFFARQHRPVSRSRQFGLRSHLSHSGGPTQQALGCASRHAAACLYRLRVSGARKCSGALRL